MKYLKLILAIAIMLFSCQQEPQICDYEVQGQTNYVIDIITATDTLSVHPDFDFPYTSPFLEDLQEDLGNLTGQECTITVDASRIITIQVRSEVEFVKAIFSNNLDGSNSSEMVFLRHCE